MVGDNALYEFTDGPQCYLLEEELYHCANVPVENEHQDKKSSSSCDK